MGSLPMNTAVHRAQINFGDLTPYKDTGYIPSLFLILFSHSVANINFAEDGGGGGGVQCACSQFQLQQIKWGERKYFLLWRMVDVGGGDMPSYPHLWVKYGVRSPNFIWAPCAWLYSLAETPQLPSPPHLGS